MVSVVAVVSLVLFQSGQMSGGFVTMIKTAFGEYLVMLITLATTAAVAYAKDVLPRAIEDCLQAHGGIGFTFEYPIHLYLRRAQSISMLLERPQFSYAAVSNIVLQNAGPAAPY